MRDLLVYSPEEVAGIEKILWWDHTSPTLVIGSRFEELVRANISHDVMAKYLFHSFVLKLWRWLKQENTAKDLKRII